MLHARPARQCHKLVSHPPRHLQICGAPGRLDKTKTLTKSIVAEQLVRMRIVLENRIKCGFWNLSLAATI